MTVVDPPDFERGAVRPLECLRGGWRLVTTNYWLFVGITFVGTLLAGLGPHGILAGPCICGIYYCLMRHEYGRRVDFGMLFKGFDHFLQSWIATLLMLISMFVVMIPAYIVFFVSFVSTIPTQPRNAPLDEAWLWSFLGMMGLFYLALLLVVLAVHIAFFFTYPLIVDRGLTGIDAVKTSFRAVAANLPGVVGLVLLNALIGMAGVLCCYVGAILVMPVTFGATLMAYRQAFPDPEAELPAESY